MRIVLASIECVRTDGREKEKEDYKEAQEAKQMKGEGMFFLRSAIMHKQNRSVHPSNIIRHNSLHPHPHPPTLLALVPPATDSHCYTNNPQTKGPKLSRLRTRDGQTSRLFRLRGGAEIER